MEKEAFIIKTVFGLCLKIEYRKYNLSISFEQGSKNEEFVESDFRVLNPSNLNITSKVFKTREFDIIPFTMENLLRAIKFIDKDILKISTEKIKQFSSIQITPQKATYLVKLSALHTNQSYENLRRRLDMEDYDSEIMLPSGAKLYKRSIPKGKTKKESKYFIYGYHHSGDDIKCYNSPMAAG